MKREGVWDPEGKKQQNGDDSLKVDARPAFAQPVAIETTKAELKRIIARLKSDGRDKQIHVSNQMFRRCIGQQLDESTLSDVFEEYCGNVLVFYCARFLLDGRGIPFLED